MITRPRPAFTLLEMILSLSIMTVLLFAMGGAVILASRAVPEETASVQEVPRIARGIDRLLEDAATAMLFLERTSSTITFLVPDRDGDGNPESIRYAWSGAAGDPLTRRVNGGSEEQIIAALELFSLSAETRITFDHYAAPIIESGETELISQTDVSPPRAVNVQENSFWGQHFKPTFDASVQSWSVTRVLFRASQDSGNAGDVLNVELRTPEADFRPSATILESVPFDSPDLPASAGYVEAAFSAVEKIAPTTGLCLCATTGAGQQPAKVHGGKGIVFANGGLAQGTPAWAAPIFDEALAFYVYGRTISTGTDGSVRRTVLEELAVAALGSGEPAVNLESTVRLLNEPLALSGYWEADFSSDPTLLDVNGDGLHDWRTDDLAAFNPLELDSGYWWALDQLWTNPACSFDEPTIVEVRARNEVFASAPGVITLNVARNGDTFGVIEATFERTSALAQQVEVHTVESDGTPVPLVSRTIGTGWFDLRFLVDPVGQVVNVRLDDVDLGSFIYEQMTAPGAPEGIGLYAASGASGAQFDELRITVGGMGTPQGANAAPMAVMSIWPTWQFPGGDVSFDGTDSLDPEGGPLTYSWDFGDGQTASGAEVVHVYDAVGVYTVTLTVTDDGGETNVAHGAMEIR